MSQAMRGMRHMLVLAVAAVALLTVVGAAFAARAGTLDDSFGHDGIVRMRDFRGFPQALEVGRHGRIVAAGFRGKGWGPGDPIALIRLRPNGHLDHSFAHDGIKTTPFGSYARADSIVLGHNGGIVAAGQTCLGHDRCDIAVVRYTRNGHLKRSFGDGGKMSLNVGFEDLATSIARDPGHGFVVAGEACPADGVIGERSCNIVLTRLTGAGSVDSSFGDDGVVVTDFDSTPAPGGCPRSEGAADMELDSSRRIVVGGTCAHKDMALARFEPGGSLDPEFGDGGTLRRTAPLEGVDSLSVDSHDRIDVDGLVDRKRAGKGRFGFAVMRFRHNGILDMSFGPGGSTATVDPGGRSMDLDSRGRIVIAGGRFAFTRFRADGGHDRFFGNDGVAKVGKRHHWHFAYALSMDVDRRDRVVGAGFRRGHRVTFVRVHG